MRKTAKILSLILSVVLLAGAIATIVSAAELPSVEAVTNLVPEGAELTSKTDPSFLDAKIWTTRASDFSDGSSSFFAGGNFGSNVTRAVKTSGSNSYYHVGIKDGATNSYTTTAGYPIEDISFGGSNVDFDGDGTFDADFTLANFDYVTIDFDLMSDKYVDANGEFTDENTGKLAYARINFLVQNAQNMRLEYDSSKGTWLFAGAPLSKTAGEWNHITAVYLVDSKKLQVYINGQYKATCGSLSALSYIRAQYVADFDPAISGNRNRKFSNCFSMGYDNFSVNFYKDGYDGTFQGGCNMDYSDLVFNYEYQFQAPNVPVANVTTAEGAATNYFYTKGAIKNITEGSTLTLADGQTVTGYIPTCNFDVVCADGAFTLAENTGYGMVETETGFSIRKYDCVINWLGMDGKLYATSAIMPGTEPTNVPTAIDSYREAGNWIYKLNWNGTWKNESGETVTDFTALGSGEHNLTADMTVPVFALDEKYLMFNFDVANRFTKYLYIPCMTDADNFLYGDEDITIKNASKGTYGEGENAATYYKIAVDYLSPVSAKSLESTWTTLTATINGQSSDYKPGVPGLTTYIQKVLTSNSTDYYAKKLCVNMAQYCDAVYNYTQGTTESPYYKYINPNGDYAAYTSMLINTNSDDFDRQIAKDAAMADISRLIDYIEGASLYFGETGIPRIAFKVKDGLTYDGQPVTITQIVYGYNTFMDEEGNIGRDYAYLKTNYSGYYYNKNVNEKVYYYANNLGVTIHLSNGAQENGVFNIAYYIDALMNGQEVTGKDAPLNVAKAMYAYSMAAIEYLTTPVGTPAPGAQ